MAKKKTAKELLEEKVNGNYGYILVQYDKSTGGVTTDSNGLNAIEIFGLLDAVAFNFNDTQFSVNK